MKDQSIAGAIILLAVAVFLVGGIRTSPVASDQYIVNDGKVFRFPGAVQGRVEVLEKNDQGKYRWVEGG
jgi:hypothetical protein